LKQMVYGYGKDEAAKKETVHTFVNGFFFMNLVELRRVELLSENKSPQASTGVDCGQHSLRRKSTVKLTLLVVSNSWQVPKQKPAHVHR
jgi:hypothetical protein